MYSSGTHATTNTNAGIVAGTGAGTNSNASTYTTSPYRATSPTSHTYNYAAAPAAGTHTYNYITISPTTATTNTYAASSVAAAQKRRSEEPPSEEPATKRPRSEFASPSINMNLNPVNNVTVSPVSWPDDDGSLSESDQAGDNPKNLDYFVADTLLQQPFDPAELYAMMGEVENENGMFAYCPCTYFARFRTVQSIEKAKKTESASEAI